MSIELPSRKAQALLAFLAHPVGKAHRRDTIANLLWGRTTDSQGRQSLRQTLTALRKALAPHVDAPFSIQGDLLALDPASFASDVSYFETLADRLSDASDIGELSSAVSNYRGDFLSGLNIPEYLFEEWLQLERRRLNELLIKASRRLIALQREAGDRDAAVLTALRILSVDPLQEEIHRSLMQLYVEQGRQAKALKQFQLCCDVLQRELGLAPEPETRALFNRIRQDRMQPGDSHEPEQIAAARRTVRAGNDTLDLPAGPPDAGTQHPDEAGAGPRLSPVTGERKRLTVLFADVAQSTKLVADLDPEEALMRMDPILDAMSRAVTRFDGLVTGKQGDGLVALFGAPRLHEDHAARACHAALRMQAGVERVTDGEVQIRVGIHTGEVILRGGAGTERRLEVTGPVFHLARRIEESVPPGAIGLSDETRKAVKEELLLQTLGPQVFEGVRQAMEVYLLLGISRLPLRDPAGPLAHSTEFVGRRDEMRLAAQALARASEGQGEVVGVIGPPGVGKSRFVHEFVEDARAQGWMLLRSGAASYDTQISLRPFATLFRTLCGVALEDAKPVAADKVSRYLQGLDPQLASVRPALLALLDLPVDDPDWSGASPQERKRRMLEAVKSLLFRLSDLQPLVLVVEDVHWIDVDTQATLDMIVNGLPSARFLLVVTYRPEYPLPWGTRTHFMQVRLDPLTAEASDRLLGQLIGGDEALRELRNLIALRSEGTPLFMEECVQNLIETRQIEEVDGRWRATNPITEIDVPPSVKTVIAARIDRLDPMERRVLQIASVIGVEVRLALLQPIVDLDSADLDSVVRALQAAELLLEARSAPAPTFLFKHALIHDVAYESLLKQERKALHARVVEISERLFAERLDEHVERLADHAVKAELWDRACGYLTRASDKSVDRSNYRASVGFLETAVAAVKHLSETPETIAQAIDIRTRLRPSLDIIGAYDACEAYLQEAQVLAEKLGDPMRLMSVLLHRSYIESTYGRFDEAITHSTRLQAVAEEVRDQPYMAEAALSIAQAYAFRHEPGPALTYMQPYADFFVNQRRFDRFGQLGIRSIWCLIHLGVSNALTGRFDAAYDQLKEAEVIATTGARPIDIVCADYALAEHAVLKGRTSEAIPMLQDSIESQRAADLLSYVPWHLCLLGYALIAADRSDEARGILQEVVSTSEAMSLIQYKVRALAYLSFVDLVEAKSDVAVRAADGALTGVLALKDPWLEVKCRRSIAAAAAVRDDLTAFDAVAQARQALTVARTHDLRPELARCLAVYGRICDRSGEKGDADAAFEEAARICAQLGMDADRLVMGTALGSMPSA